jgi:GNAT superfamily N-acetyltransferase
MISIRPCQERDIALLRGHTSVPEQRFERQQRGDSTFLVAWDGDVPVGSGEIRWIGCAAPEIHEHYPDCPELNGLNVWPSERRSQGIGTALITAAEDLARDRGRREFGMGVVDTNPRAAALYLRIGYQETGLDYLDRYHYTDSDGVRHDIADPARFLVKPLTSR